MPPSPSGVAMLGALGDPGGPERRAVAAALRTTAQVLGLGADATPRDWHVAHVALRRAERCAGAAAPAARPPLLALLHRAEGLLTDAVLAPDDPRVAAQAGLLLQDRAPLRRPPARWPRRRRPGRTVEAAGPDRTDARWSPPPEVRVAREQQVRHVAVLRLFTAARVFLGAGVAGAGALALGLGHPYWAPVSAAAVLQATHVRMTWHRSIQRGLGTAAGLLLGALLLAAHPDPVLIAVLVVLMQLGIEVFIRRNYALGVLFITPMTMLLSDLLVPSSTYDLVVDRLGGVALGIVVGLAAALVVSHPRAAVTLRHAVDRCELAMTWARSAPRAGWPPRRRSSGTPWSTCGRPRTWRGARPGRPASPGPSSPRPRDARTGPWPGAAGWSVPGSPRRPPRWAAHTGVCPLSLTHLGGDGHRRAPWFGPGRTHPRHTDRGLRVERPRRAGSGRPGRKHGSTLERRAHQDLASYDRAVTGAGEGPGLQPVGPLTQQIGQWAPSEGGDHKRSFAADLFTADPQRARPVPPDRPDPLGRPPCERPADLGSSRRQSA